MFAAELVFGTPLTLPGEFLEATTKIPAELITADFVLIGHASVTPPLTPLYHGPGHVSFSYLDFRLKTEKTLFKGTGRNQSF